MTAPLRQHRRGGASTIRPMVTRAPCAALRDFNPAYVGFGSWLCENSSARRARRNISKKLRTMESNRAPRTMFDTLLENCIFYISQLYEFSHRLGQDRLSEECPRRVRFTSTNRHQSPRLSRPVSATSGLMHPSKEKSGRFLGKIDLVSLGGGKEAMRRVRKRYEGLFDTFQIV